MKKPNKVSWASGPNLCQVKHFLEEDSPSEVGRGSQHHLQLNRTRPSIIRSSSEGRCLKQSKDRQPSIIRSSSEEQRHPSIIRSSSEGRQCLKERLSHRSLAKWKCPPKFNLNEKWCVVAGEESKEAENQELREKRVFEAVYPWSAIPSNPYTSSELEQYYDDSQTPIIRIIPIEEEADVEVPFHLTPVQTISSKSPDACIPNSPSSVSIGTSQKLLPANGKSVPQSLSTFQNPRKPQSNSLFSVRWPSNVQSAPPYLSSCQNLKGSSQQVSPKPPPVSYNPVPHSRPTFKNLSTPDQTDFFPDKPANCSTPDQTEFFSDQLANHCTPYQTENFPDKPANQNHAPKHQTACANQNISQPKPQVSGSPPANHNPVTQFPSTCENPDVTVAVAVAALAKAQEQGSLIDGGLLVNLLLNPGEIQKLMSERSTVTDPKPDMVINKPITEYQASHVGSGPIFGRKPMEKSGPLTITKPETSMQSNLANEEEIPPRVLLNPGEILKLLSECLTVTDPKPDKVCNKPIPEYQASHAGSGPIFGRKPMEKSGPLTMTKPETSVKSNLANEEGIPPRALLNPGEIQKLMSERRMFTDPKPDKVFNKPITEYQASHAGSGLIFGPKPIAKSGSLTMTKPEASVQSNLANEQGVTHHVPLNPVEILKLMSESRMFTDPKPVKVNNKPITDYKASHAGPGLIFGSNRISKSGPLTMTKPEASVKSNLANEQGAPPHVGTANIRGSKPLVNPTSDLNLEKVKKLINEYGAPDNIGGKLSFNSDLISSSFSKCDVVLSRADLPTTLQSELQKLPLSPNAGHRLPFSLTTDPAPIHKTINYCKSLIKEHGDNRESVVDERNSRSTIRGPGLLNNRIPNHRSLNIQKPCNFFNKPGGCFNGSSCPFVHELSGQRRPGGMLKDRDSKRMR